MSEQMPTWITARAAERLLAETGLVRVQAHQALSAGLAGVPTRQGRARMYRREAVEHLAARRRLRTADLQRFVESRADDSSLLVLRRFVDLSTSLEQQDAQLTAGWDLGVWTPPILRIYLSLGRFVGVVVTVAGFVVRGFDLRGTVPDPDQPGCRRLLLDEPGPWFGELRETRLDLGRGHPWRLVQKRFRP